ncbi:YecR family lipoprotein [Enterobacter hormaechei]|uniref:YecR family lipoprotein n=2 Tax=Enterobacter hormaechei TaxID=158836 RepID=UPI001113285C
MKKFLMISVTLTVLSGCATPPPLGTIQASKADGVVTVGYLLDGSQPSYFKGDFKEAEAKATKICKSWGYKSASSIDGDLVRTDCRDASMFAGCLIGQQSRIYQCEN